MKGRKLLRWFGFLFLGLLVLAGSTMSYAWWQREALLNALVAELNEHLQQPVEVDKLGLSFRAFPSISLRMSGVRAIDSNGDTLISARDILASSSMRLWLKGNYTIDKLHLNSARVFLSERQNGQWNFEEFVRMESADSSQSSVQWRSITWSDVRLKWRSDKSQQSASTFINHGYWESETSLEKWLLKSELKESGYKAGKDEYRLPPMDLAIRSNANSLSISGIGDDWKADIEKEADDSYALIAEIGNLLDWMERTGQKIDPRLNDLKSSWNIQGRWKEDIGSFRIHSNKLTWSNEEGKELQAELAFNYNWDSQSSKAVIDTFHIHSDASELQILGSWNIKSDISKLTAKGRIDLEEWSQWIPEVLGTKWKGKLELDASYSGSLKKADWEKNSRLLLRFDKLAFERGEDIRLKNTKGNLEWNRTRLKIDDLLTSANGQELFINGWIDGLGNENSIPTAQLQIRTQSLRLHTNSKDSENSIPLQLPKLNAELLLEADELQIDRLQLNQLRASLDASPDKILVHRLFAQSLDGQIELSGELLAEEEGFKLQTQGKVTELKLDQLFAAFSNFGQSVITEQQLSGRLSSEIDLSLQLDKDLNPITNSIALNANSLLEKAKLRDFSPLELVAEKVQLDELEELSIDKHEQRWRIKNKRIYFEKSEWKSSAIDVDIEGVHDFDNKIDYRFSLPIQRVVSKKSRKWMDEELDEYVVEVQTRKQPLIHLRVTGSMEEPSIQLDEDAFKTGLKKEWEDQNIFKKDNKTDNTDKEKPALQFEWNEPRDSSL